MQVRTVSSEDNRPEQVMTAATRECPSCALDIAADADVCPYCDYDLPRDKGGTMMWAWIFILLLMWPLYQLIKELR